MYNDATSVAHITASANGYDHNLQFLPWGTTTVVKDMVMRRMQAIIAGDSVTVVVDTNSSICTDLEDWLIPATRCAQIHVSVPANGTLVIDARPLRDPDALAVVFSATTGFYRRQILGPGTVTLLEVRAGRSYHIFVGASEGTVPQQYELTTLLQPAAKPN